MKENFELFDNSEFESWSKRKGLNHAETYIIKNYILSKDEGIDILDIGTGNGRFLFELASSGFEELTGIDLSENLINVAKSKVKETKQSIEFHLMDASKMTFANERFDIVIALQQIISLISNKNDRIAAINEIYRVLKPNGLLLISVLDFNGRWFNPLLSMFCTPIKIIRAEFDFINYKYLPWLLLGNKINFEYLRKSQSYTYWYNKKEILQELSKFNIIEVISTKMINDKISKFKSGGMLFIVAQKQ
jgi:ubiquinone/menaquinone biosynthesis C-methylase UbiE